MAPQAQSNLAIAASNNNVNYSPITTKKYDGNPDFFALVESMKLLGRQGFIDLLLEKGSRVVTRGTALNMAVARMGWSSVIEKLLALGAKFSDKNSHGDTALHLAFVCGETDGLVDLLLNDFLSETTVNVANNDGLNFFHIACTRTNPELVQQFIDCGVDINCQVDLKSRSQYAGYNPLHFAVQFDRHDIAELLLCNGASIYVQDKTASTPVHLALNNSNQPMIDLLFAHDRRTENYINNFGMTHFMATCAGSVPYIAEEFLYRQPMAFQRVNARVRDVDEHPYAGYSPIHFATEFGNRETVQLLFDYGASSFSMTSENLSPMALACTTHRKDILRLLQKYSTRENEMLLINKISGMRDNYKWPNYFSNRFLL